MKVLNKFLVIVFVTLVLGNGTNKTYAFGECTNSPDPPPAGDGGVWGGNLDPNTCCTIPGSTATVSRCDAGNSPILTPDTHVSGGMDCSCREAATELEEFFGIINGILIPITIILGMFIIVRAGYKILTSQGNPQELQEGKENLTSAIIGLIFVLMAVSILRVIIKALITGNADPFGS